MMPVLAVINEVETLTTVKADGTVTLVLSVIGEVIRARPNTGGDEYIRLQMNDGQSWRWGARLVEYTPLVASVPGEDDFDARWVPE